MVGKWNENSMHASQVKFGTKNLRNMQFHLIENS